MIRFLRSLTPAQWFGIVIAILSVLAGATAQLTDLFGAMHAHLIVTASNLLMTVLSSILVQMSGQSAQIRAVNDMPGVQTITVNEKANPTLAAIAVDPNSKVEATPAAAKAVEATAKGA